MTKHSDHVEVKYFGAQIYLFFFGKKYIFFGGKSTTNKMRFRAVTNQLQIVAMYTVLWINCFNATIVTGIQSFLLSMKLVSSDLACLIQSRNICSFKVCCMSS